MFTIVYCVRVVVFVLSFLCYHRGKATPTGSIASSNFGEIVKSFPAQNAPGCFFIDPTPLLEKEGDSSRIALGLNIQNPAWCHGPGGGPAFSTDDDSLDVGQTLEGYRSKEWFDRKKMNHCGYGDEMGDSLVGPALIFNARTQPDIRFRGCF